MRLPRALPWLVGLAATCFCGRFGPSARDARAATPPEDPCAGDVAWVRVQVRAPSWKDEQRSAVAHDLARSLGPQGIAACLDEQHPARPPLATLDIELGSAERATVDIEVRDAVTKKRVRRDVELAAIPPDGRELAIAIEADELLRASWAEVALDTARARAAAAPPAVVTTVASVMPREPGRLALGVRGVAEHFARGLTWFGAEAFTWTSVGTRTEVELAVGMRSSGAAAAPHGVAHAWAAGGTLGGAWRWLARPSGALTLGTVLGASWVELRAEPEGTATSHAYANWLITARARLAGRLALGRALRGLAAVDVGATLRGIEGTDEGMVVARASGALFAVSLGIETP